MTTLNLCPHLFADPANCPTCAPTARPPKRRRKRRRLTGPPTFGPDACQVCRRDPDACRRGNDLTAPEYRHTYTPKDPQP